jgi:hypothetical protein
MAMVTSTLADLHEALSQLPDSLHVARGRALTAEEIVALGTALGVSFPDDYRAFLAQYGSLAIYRDSTPDDPDLFVMGSRGDRAGTEVDLLAAQEHVRAESLRWSDDQALAGIAVAPFYLSSPQVDGWSNAYVFDATGEVGNLYRGALDLGGTAFEEFVVEQLQRLVRRASDDFASDDLL